MHSTSRLVLVFVGGTVLGVALCIAALLVFVRTTAGKALLRGYFASAALSEASRVDSTKIGAIPPPSLATSSTAVLVPKALATREYYMAINSVVFDFNNAVALLAQLQPILVAINTQSSTGDYTGILDRIVAAKSLIAQERIVAARFAQSLLSLSAANQSTPDAITKSSTQALGAEGVALQADLSTYIESLDTLLSGAVPTDAQIQDMLALSKKVSTRLQTFAGSMRALLDHFEGAVKSN